MSERHGKSTRDVYESCQHEHSIITVYCLGLHDVAIVQVLLNGRVGAPVSLNDEHKWRTTSKKRDTKRKTSLGHLGIRVEELSLNPNP